MEILTGLVVSSIYDSCKGGYKYRQAKLITIDTPWAQGLEFVAASLERNRRRISHLLLHLPAGMMKTNGDEGMPWIFARRGEWRSVWCTNMERVKQLLTLGMALNFVKVTNPTGNDSLVDGDIPMVVIENNKIINQLKIDESNKRKRNRKKTEMLQLREDLGFSSRRSPVEVSGSRHGNL